MDDTPIPYKDRRQERAVPMHVLEHIGEVMDRFREEEKDRHVKMDSEFSNRFATIEDRFDTLENKIHNLHNSITAFMSKSEALFDAFPDQDPHGHRRAHEIWLEESKEKKEFYISLKKELAKYGLIGVAGWLFFQALNYIRTGT